MTAASRRKGYRAEAAVARWLREHGWPHAERRSSGMSGADIHGILPFTIEVKDRHDLANGIREGLQQAEHAAGRSTLPVCIAHPQGEADPSRWYAVMRLEDWNELAKEWESAP